MRVLQLPINEGNGAKSTFFLRIPPSNDKDSIDKKHPLLVINPSVNHGGAEYILDANSWAHFADEYGIYLLIPEFDWMMGGRSDYEIPQNYSGKVLLEAVNWLGKNYPVSTERFLIHGYGGGGIFTGRFVRWAPERIFAASINSTGEATWFDGDPDLKPFSALRPGALFLSCGDRDDFRINLCSRLAITEEYASSAKDAGVDVEWKVLTDTGHTPTQEMEKLVQDFFVRKAHLTKRTP